MSGIIPKTVGELSLSKLLASLKAVLEPETYVFITLPPATPVPTTLQIQMLFHEREGLTLIATRSSAVQAGFSYTFPCRLITLDVHSSLEAVGFMAAITNTLKELKIGVNPVSGYYHDHIFVPEGTELETMAALARLRDKAKSESGPLLPPI